MPERDQHMKCLPCLLRGWGLTLVALFCPWAASAEPPRFLGVDDCRSCHALTDDSLQQRSPWVDENEYFIWHDYDRHSRAFHSLQRTGNPDAAIDRMERSLGIDATQDQRCLTCHAPLSQVPSLGTDSAALRQQGVSCEACHGPSESWSTPHRFADWRGQTTAYKAELGMRDMRDPLTKAQVCTSCHVGDASARRLVTHAMYAAGHPPLAGFEAVGYSQSMPPHWTPLRDKSAELTRGLPHYDPDELIDTKAALLGNAAAFQQVMRLIVDNAETALNAAPGLSARQPEFALYDCHACHHALARSENSWRQKPGYTLHFPGRPRAPRWTFALLHVAAQLALPQTATTDASLADLETAYAIQPFGQPRQLRDSARAAEAWCAELIDALQNASFSRNAPDADRLIELIAAAAAGPLDYDTARQLAWTLDVLAAEQAARPLDTSMSAWDELLGLYRPLDAPSGFRLRDLAHQHRRQFDPASFRALLGGPSAAQ